MEKIINGIDAILMAECFKKGIDPEGPDAPRSMSEAVEKFFKVREGRLENLQTKEQTELAELITVVAVGEKTSPCYIIADFGEGQTPDRFPDTLLSLTRGNKDSIPFVQGKFNCGGTGVLPFCGKRKMQLVISRRHPNAPVQAGDKSGKEWGFTLVRRILPRAGRKNPVFVYLAPAGKVLRFEADGVPVLPERRNSVTPRPYMEKLPYGTCIKVYNFEWKARSIATTEARYELERYLHSPCLPFRVTETRDYKANFYSTTICGVWTTVAARSDDPEKARVEPGFAAAFGELNLRGIGRMPYRIVVFKEEVDSRRIPRGVTFTVNGQVHGGLPSDFIARQLKFDFLKDHLLVSVDCTHMDEAVRYDFFMASRDRLRRNPVYDTLVDALKDDLLEHQGLRELNAQRRKKQLDKAVNDGTETTSVFNDLLKSDPTIAALFQLGDRLITRAGPGPSEPFVGRKFPSFFRIINEPKLGLVKRCPVNRTCRVEFETDATNDYFDRADCRGAITTDPPGLIEHQHLWNGIFSAKFAAPWNLEPGKQATITVHITDVEAETRGRPFESVFTVIGSNEVEPPQPSAPGGPRRSSRPQENGKTHKTGLAIPEVRDEHRREEPYQSIRISHSNNGGYDFFLNLDNAFLLTELTRAKEDDRPLVTFWFKYGLALCALGMIQEGKRHNKQAGSGVKSQDDSENDGEDLDEIGTYCNGVARVIVPVIRALYRGPQAST